MALEGLHLTKDEEKTSGRNTDLIYPNLSKMVDYICRQQPKLLKQMEEKLLFPSKTFVAMIKFLMKCFETEYRTNSCQFDVDLSDSPAVTMSVLLENAMSSEGSSELHSTASKALVEIGSHLPEVPCLNLC